MSDYTSTWSKATGGTIEVSDFTTEFNAIATASATKAGTAETNNFTAAQTVTGVDLTMAGGDIVLGDGDGIDFSAYTDGSVAGSTTSQILLDYEEGTWTPVLTDGTNNATSSVAVGHYTKIGRSVHFTGQLTTTSLGSVSGAVFISGLPYTSNSTANSHAAAHVGQGAGLAITVNEVVAGFIAPNAVRITLTIWDDTIGTGSLTDTEWTADGSIIFSGMYIV